MCSATAPSRVRVNAQPSTPEFKVTLTTTYSLLFIIQSPNTTGAGSSPATVATLMLDMVDALMT
ncbi:unannotated protein [freshwater metagenome]|uniref:Unannotated protein n=1 Tax=freshwater metagenome TaxID=449393 RepID=A0A6J7TMD7_9ZZZZ